MENNICNKNEQKYITKKKEKSRIIIHFQTDISIIRSENTVEKDRWTGMV